MTKLKRYEITITLGGQHKLYFAFAGRNESEALVQLDRALEERQSPIYSYMYQIADIKEVN